MKKSKNGNNRINLSQIPSFKYLGAFERAASLGSFTKAGLDLGRSSSAISRAISELEDMFECVLFERLGKEVRLTDAGRKYLSDVRVALQILEKADRILSMNKKTKK